MENYKTPLHEKIDLLEKEGYNNQYRLSDGKLKNLTNGGHYAPHQLKLMREYRFEGISNPGDMSILYAIQAEDGSKGTVVDSYGTYADNELGEFLNQVGKREE